MGIICRWWRRLFRLRIHFLEEERKEPELEPEIKPSKPITWLEKAKARWPSFRVIITSQNLPNAPKKQPCRSCRGWVRRTRKTMGLAFYWCTKCKVETVVKLRR